MFQNKNEIKFLLSRLLPFGFALIWFIFTLLLYLEPVYRRDGELYVPTSRWLIVICSRLYFAFLLFHIPVPWFRGIERNASAKRLSVEEEAVDSCPFGRLPAFSPTEKEREYRKWVGAWTGEISTVAFSQLSSSPMRCMTSVWIEDDDET